MSNNFVEIEFISQKIFMKIIISALFFILMNYIGAFAQTNQNLTCPTIYVTGPSSVPNPGDLIAYSVVVGENKENYKLKYIWTVSSGEIIKGQGTNFIQSTFDYYSSLVATVKIEGLPEHCDNTFSEVMNVDPSPESEKVNDFVLVDKKIPKNINNKLIDAVRNNLSAQLYVIFYFRKNSSQKSVEQKMRQIEDYLVNVNGIDKQRITKVKAFAEKQETVQFWLVPAGVTPPIPEKLP